MDAKPRLAIPWKAILPLALGALIALLPVPPVLEPRAWWYFALFAAVILALVLEPVPAAAVGLVGVTVAAILRLPFRPEQLARGDFDAPAEAIRWALSGFSNTTVWLIFAAFMFALGYERTGLGRRIALVLVKRLGRRTLGLGYALALADLVLAPLTPSNTARSAGTIYPVVRSIAPLYGSEPGPTARRVGSYLMWTAFASTCVTSSMFLTALAPNPLAVEIVKKTVGLDITWSRWALGFAPVGLVLLLLVPLLVYFVHPPEVKTSDEFTRWAGEQLAALGRFNGREAAMAILVLFAVAAWVFGRQLMDATTVAITVVALMVVLRVVTWAEVLSNSQAWNVLVWFATLVALADGLSRVGFTSWFARSAAGRLSGLSPLAVMLALVALFFFAHYLFASISAHTTALLPVFLAAGAAVPGMPVAKLAFVLVYSLGIMGVIGPYATGPAPVYFESGYISRRDFWKLGLAFGLFFLSWLIIVGVPYLTLITR